ncbi:MULTISPECIES: hypothetical protein [Methylomicrobium]|uniref:hypothetical protein n=1 Tax=Methylomicrobium TaxID=39773 RepID=UPI0002623F65|nr:MULTISPECIES: hypothetical protein [Methylomicrobium]
MQSYPSTLLVNFGCHPKAIIRYGNEMLDGAPHFRRVWMRKGGNWRLSVERVKSGADESETGADRW